jgi:hypothetical protein
MKLLLIEGTVHSPAVKSDGAKGFFELKGRSNPENVFEFYKPIIEWINEYEKAPAASTNVNIKLEYFNTSSSKIILKALKKFEAIYKANNEVIINWYCDAGDVDMLQAAKDYESLIAAPFNIIES